MRTRSFDPEAAKQHVVDAHERLATALDGITSTEGWQSYLRMQSRFHTYSWGNTMLIAMQAPGARYVKGYRGWQEMGRQVRKGEKAIRILAPRPWQRVEEDETGAEVAASGISFTTAAIFEVGQTDPIAGATRVFDPEAPRAWMTGAEEVGDEAVCQRLMAALLAFNEGRGVSVSIGAGDHPTAGGSYTPSTQSIWVRERDCAPMVSTFIHETAHSLCMAVNEEHGYAAGEVVVEAVAFIVADYFGLEALAPTSEYVASWLTKDGAAFKRGLAVIQSTASELIAAIESELGAATAAPLSGLEVAA